MSRRGGVLRARRESLGLSLEDLSRRTRIPAEHLQALEEDRDQDLPAGPYAAAYLRTLRAELDVDLDLEDPEQVAIDERVAPGIPLPFVRLIAGTLVLSLLSLIGWQTWTRLGASAAQTSVASPPVAPDQVVTIVARKNTRLAVTVDGQVVLDRAIAGGEELVFSGHDRVEVDIDAADALRVEYNGRAITPLGRQDAPRRLVFVDDLGDAP